MPRGGTRLNAGAKPKWKHGKTKTIRVPESLLPQILEYAHKLDQGVVSTSENKTVNFSNVSIHRVNGKSCVFIQDLIKSGYLIKPSKLADVVLREIELFSK